jgi:hypothetical protein
VWDDVPVLVSGKDKQLSPKPVESDVGETRDIRARKSVEHGRPVMADCRYERNGTGRLRGAGVS